MPRYLQSMVSLCWAPVLPGASWDPSGGGSCSGGSSVPGDALNPLPAAPGTVMAVVWGGRRGGGRSKRLPRVTPLSCCGCWDSQMFSLGSSWVDGSAGIGCQPCWGRGSSPGVLVAPHGRALRRLAARQRVCLPSQKLPPQCPSPWHRACALGCGAEGRMSPLPSSLPASWGETEARECFPRPGRVSMEMGAGVQAPSCRRGHPLNKGESGTLMGAQPPGRVSQPQPKIAPPGEHRTGSRPGANPAAGRGSPGSGSSQGVTPSPACRRLLRPVALGKGRAGGGRIKSRTKGGGRAAACVWPTDTLSPLARSGGIYGAAELGGHLCSPDDGAAGAPAALSGLCRGTPAPGKGHRRWQGPAAGSQAGCDASRLCTDPSPSSPASASTE